MRILHYVLVLDVHRLAERKGVWGHCRRQRFQYGTFGKLLTCNLEIHFV